LQLPVILMTAFPSRETRDRDFTALGSVIG
jgi:hypothetical protein